MQLKFSNQFPSQASEYSFILCSTAQEKAVLDALRKNEYVIPNGIKLGEADQKNYYHSGKSTVFIQGIGSEKDLKAEKLRRYVFQAVKQGNELKKKELLLWFPGLEKCQEPTVMAEAIGESLLLSNYQFLKYKTKGNGANTLKSGVIATTDKSFQQAIRTGETMAQATCKARDLVNEPVITLTAEELGKQAKLLSVKHGFKADVWDKKKIEKAQMGGLLAVNLGSPNPPSFIILEHKPAKAKNKKPVVFVGKGVVYDTGGLSLKPTPNSMDSMKSDMAGAAAVIGAFCAIADLKLPYHVIGLIPATDNRPGGNAYTPGDVIKMYDGSTVEVLNTDAEGRMILADALAYAKQYQPEVVVDLATLTGAAVVAVGHIGIAMMSTASESTVQCMAAAGEATHERVVRFPLWDEYEELLKSDIADQKNIGGPYGGSITAAKFLQVFTDYPWIHLDIAGPAFLPHQDYYRSKNGTGVGVRLLVNFLKRM
jgi:leucyl aminopeptidase